MDFEQVIFVAFAVAAICYKFLFPLKCLNCQTKLKLEIILPDMGVNITKKVTIGIEGTGSDSYYTCPKCSSVFKKRNRRLIEVEKIPHVEIK